MVVVCELLVVGELLVMLLMYIFEGVECSIDCVVWEGCFIWVVVCCKGVYG